MRNETLVRRTSNLVSTLVGICFCSAAAAAAAASSASAQVSFCDVSGFKPFEGIQVETRSEDMRIIWDGDEQDELRLVFVLQNQVPTIRELSLRRQETDWVQVLSNVVPDFAVVTGVRRISNQQLAPLRALNVPINKETVDKYRWDPFWDAPLDTSVPPTTGPFSNAWAPPEGISAADQPGLPRDPTEIQRASVAYEVSECRAYADGARLVVEFPGVTLGLFSGRLRFTIFRGTNLIQQEIIAKTDSEWVAYKYDAGLRGLTVGENSRVAWRDTSNTWQENNLSGGLNSGPVALRAANRLIGAEQGRGAITAFPPPHRFFWAREISVNVGYNWYRKDSADSYSFGVRQNEHEDFAHERFLRNWALYSARPGTEQQMTVFLYPTIGRAEDAIQKSLKLTNGDTYKPLPGFQVMNHHYHMDLAQRLTREGNADVKLQDLVALKALGLNIVSPIDSASMTGFTDSGSPAPDANSPEVLERRREQNAQRLALAHMSISAAKIHSDSSFLVLPSQEVFRGPLGGHVDLIFSKPTYWDERLPGQPLIENHPTYGKVYHIGSADDLMAMARNENVLISMPHPRSKGSTGFPDAIKDRSYFADPQYHGFGARWGMGLDGSERRLCEYRCWPLLDDISNWMVSKNLPLKKILSISEVFGQSPGDDIYGSAPVTYVALPQLPGPEDVTPLIDALMTGYSFWSTGEVLIPQFEVRGTGRRSTVVADVSWTFPLDFVEVVWGDGKNVGRQIISATDLPAFGSQRFEIPFDARGKKWVRFAAWDSASNGAVVQPVLVSR